MLRWLSVFRRDVTNTGLHVLVNPWPADAASTVSLAVEPWNVQTESKSVFYLTQYKNPHHDSALPALIVVTDAQGEEAMEMLDGIKLRLSSVLTQDQGIVISTYAKSTEVANFLQRCGEVCRIRSVEEVTTCH